MSKHVIDLNAKMDNLVAAAPPTAIERVEGQNVLLSEECTIYALDVSGSMKETIGHIDGEALSKVAGVRKAMHAVFTSRLANPTADSVGIVTFGDYAKVVMEPTIIEQSHMRHLESIRSVGDTPMYDALEKSARLLANAKGMARIVLLSDGMPNAGGHHDDVLHLAEKLGKEYGIIIDTVGLGREGSTPEYDEKFLRKVAGFGSGEFYPIDSLDELVKRLVTTINERRMLLGKGVALLGDASAAF